MKKLVLTLVVALAGCLTVGAHDRKGLRINEVMIENTNSVVDGYGNRSAWIELFNTNFGPIDISSIYITNDPANHKMYPVPMGDNVTHMGKRQYIVFYADDMATRGTLHTNFTLNPDTDNWIGIYDADGNTLIDEVTIPAGTLKANESYARAEDGGEEWVVRHGTTDPDAFDYVTPGSANRIKDTNDRVEKFHEKDAQGFALTITAMCIVFSALFILCVSFILINKIGAAINRRNKREAKGITKAEARSSGHSEADSGEEIAAIVMALHEHLNAHDTETAIITINKVKKAYSPWSSKIYSMREVPNRK